MENNTARVEGAMPDEKVIGDNVLETLQPAHATARHAARLDSNLKVCHDTIERQEADAMAARLVYTDAEVMVELVAQADFKPNVLNLAGSPREQCNLTMPCKLQMLALDVHGRIATLLRGPGRADNLCCWFVCVGRVYITKACLYTSSCCGAGDRKSKRARKGRAPIKVSADDKVHDLKLKIVQTLNVHPENALLHVFREGQWQVLGDDVDARLAGNGSRKLTASANTHNAGDPHLGSADTCKAELDGMLALP